MIIRANKIKNYTIMSNHHLKDKNLSIKAKGLMSYILSLPDDWDIYLEELSEHSSDGITCIRSAWKELEENGYVENKKVYENGRIKKWIKILHEIPTEKNNNKDLEKLDLENLNVENVDEENQTLLNTNTTKELIKQKTNNTISSSSSSNTINSIGQEITALPVDDDKKTLVSFWQRNVNAIESPIVLERLTEWLDDFDVDTLQHAIELMLGNGVKSLNYLNRILYGYLKNSVKTLEQAKECDNRFTQRKSYGNNQESYSELYKDSDDPYDLGW